MKHRDAKAYLFFGLLATYAGLMLANPVFPPLARELGLSEVQAGLIISVTALVFTACSPIWGALSERIGRKPVFVIGLFGAGIGLTLFAVTAQLGLMGAVSSSVLLAMLLACRVFAGAFMGGAPVSAQAFMADITETSDRSAGMAVIGAANGIGTLLGPAAAALLVTLGLLAPFYTGAALILATALALAFLMPSSPRQQKLERPPKLRPWDRRIWPFLFLGFATVTVIVLLQVTLGFYLIDRFALSPVSAAQMSGAALFVVGIALAVVQGVFVTRFKWSPRTLLRAGAPVMTAGLAGALLAPSLPYLIGAFAVMGVGGGLLFPGFTSGVSLAVNENEQGSVAGLSGAANGAGAVIGPLVGTGLYQLNALAPYLAATALFFGLTVFVWRCSSVARAKVAVMTSPLRGEAGERQA